MIDEIQIEYQHYQLLLNDKPEKLANLEIRSHILYYLKGMPNSKEMKNKVCQCKNSEQLINILNEYKKVLENI